MHLFKRFFQVLCNRKGSSTIEYVILMSAGAILASALLNALYSEAIKKPMVAVIENHIACLNEEPTCNRGSGSTGKTELSEASGGGQPSDTPDDWLKRINQDLPDQIGDGPIGTGDDGGWSSDWDTAGGGQPKSQEKEPPEEEGFWAGLARKAGETWDGLTEAASDAWDRTTELASDAWGGIKNGAEAAWDWTKDNWEYIAGGLVVAAGVGLLFVPGGQVFGAGILIGAAVGGGISALQGNDLKTVMGEAAIGGLLGAIGGGVAGGVARGAARYVGQRVSQWAGASIGSSAESLADNFLRGEKLNWKNAAAAGLLAVGSVVGLHALKNSSPNLGITPKSNQAVKQVDGVEYLGRGNGYRTDGGAIIKGQKVVQVSDVSKFRPATNNVDLAQTEKVRKELGIPSMDKEEELIQKGILKNRNTVAVLEVDGQQIWGRSGWGVTKDGYSDARGEWARGKIGKTGATREKAATNAQTLTHAEGDAFWNLYQYRKDNNILGGSAKMAVDRPLCRSCGDLKGVQNLVEEVGLEKLEIVSPDGTDVIRPREGQRRTKW